MAKYMKAAAKKTAKKVSCEKTASANKACAKKSVSKKTAARTPVKPATITTVVARIDIGWGNRLYLRGNGAGLSWDVGIPMECSKDDEWYWKTTRADGPIVFKFLKNDERWALGEDLSVEPGQTSNSSPQF